MTATARLHLNKKSVPSPTAREIDTVQLPTTWLVLAFVVFVLAVASAGYFAGSRNSPPIVLSYAPITQAPAVSAAPSSPGATLSGGAAPATAYLAPAAVAIPGLSDVVDALNGLKDAIVSALDVSNWIPSIFTGLADSIVGKDGLGNIASDVGAWLVHTPNVAMGPGSGGLLGELVGYIQAAAMAAMTCAIALTVFRVWMGLEPSPQAALLRILALSLLLALYKPGIGWAIEASNGVSTAIFALDSGEQSNVWSGVRNTVFVQNAVPGWLVLNSIVAVASFFMLMAIGFVRILSIVAFMVMYVIGPLALLTAVFPDSGWFDRWWRVGVQALVWPVLWAVELKLFIVVGATLAAESIGGAFVAPLLQLALLYAIFKTPGWVKNSQITTRARQTVRQVHTRTVERVSTIRTVSGSTLKGALVGAGGGAVAGGIGAAPGAVTGAATGLLQGVSRSVGVNVSGIHKATRQAAPPQVASRGGSGR